MDGKLPRGNIRGKEGSGETNEMLNIIMLNTGYENHQDGGFLLN